MPWDDAWQAILDWLTPLITPSWNDLIPIIPLALVGLVFAVLALLAWRWMATASINRSRVRPRIRAAAPPPGVHLPGPSKWPFVVPIGAALLLAGLVFTPQDDAGNSTSPVNLPLLLAGLLVTGVSVVGWLRDAMKEWRTTAEGVDAHGEAHGLLPSSAVAAPVERPVPPGIHLPGPSPWPFFAPIGLSFIFFGLVFSPAILVAGLLMSAIAAVGWLRDAGREYHETESGEHAPAPAGARFPTGLVAVYGLIAALSLAVVAAPGLIAFANTSPQPSASGPVGGEPTDKVQLVAKANAFDKRQFTVPAGTPFTITMDNQDTVPHNVSIYDSAQRTTALFEGPLQETTGTITYEVKGLENGDYYFVCIVHPASMNGTVTAQ
jgi:plastocyanin